MPKAGLERLAPLEGAAKLRGLASWPGANAASPDRARKHKPGWRLRVCAGGVRDRRGPPFMVQSACRLVMANPGLLRMDVSTPTYRNKLRYLQEGLQASPALCVCVLILR